MKNIYRGTCGKWHDRRCELTCEICLEDAADRAAWRASQPSLAELVAKLDALTPDFRRTSNPV